MEKDDEILLYLYKNVGLYWERTLSLDENRNMCSMVTNKELRNFFERNNSIVYNITNARDMDQKSINDNELYFTDSKSSKVRSLIHHLRNSIMHGKYEIEHRQDKIFILFNDLLPGQNRQTMKGRVELSRLQDLMNIISNYAYNS